MATQAPPLPPGTVQLIITRTPDGLVHASGPIGDKMLCYGLMEIARDTIAAYKPESSPLLVANGALPRNGVH